MMRSVTILVIYAYSFLLARRLCFFRAFSRHTQNTGNTQLGYIIYVRVYFDLNSRRFLILILLLTIYFFLGDIP